MVEIEGSNEVSSNWKETLLVFLSLLVTAFLLVLAFPMLYLLARELSCR